MCECGCAGSWERYRFRGPGKSFYILSLAGPCTYCDGPSAVLIDHIKPGHILWDEYKRGDFIDGDLEWITGGYNPMVSIITGFTQHEFRKALTPHFTAMDVQGLTENGKFDECSADVILEEMYDDAQVKPHFPK